MLYPNSCLLLLIIHNFYLNYRMYGTGAHSKQSASSHSNYSLQGNQKQGLPGKPAALIMPPALNAQQPPEGSDAYHMGKPALTISNNQHSQFQGYQATDQQQMWGANQAHIASMFWQQRCGTLLDRFQWFCERFQMLRKEYMKLSQQMQRMDSQQQWHHFQQHHDDFHQKIEELEQQLSAVLSQNEQLMQQRQSWDSQSVWEQRYNELLGNFKSLQAAGGANGGIPAEQYHNLEQHFSELEYQYGQAINEIERMKQQSPQAQLQTYKQKINTLHNENVDLQNMLAELEQQNEHLKMSQAPQVQNGQLQALLQQIEEKEHIIQQMRREFSDGQREEQLERVLDEKERESKQIKQVLGQREQEIKSLQGQISTLQQQISSQKERISSQQEHIKVASKAQNNNAQIQQQLTKYHKRVAQLQDSIQQLTTQVQKAQNQLGAQVESKAAIQRKLAVANKQISTLNDTLKNKNDQLLSLRGVSSQVDKLKAAQRDSKYTAQERDRLAQKNSKQNFQIKQLNATVNKLRQELNEVNNARQQFNTRALRQQIQDLNQQIQHGRGQLQRARSTIRLKEEYVDRLLQELQESKARAVGLESLLDQERQEARQVHIRLSSKGTMNETRIKDLDHSYHRQLKETLQRQVNQLRQQSKAQQEQIRHQEEKQLILNTQLTVLQKQQKNHDRQISLLKTKERQLQAHIQAQRLRCQQAQQSNQATQQQNKRLTQNRMKHYQQQNNLQDKLQQSKQSLSSKNDLIKKMQGQLDAALAKAHNSDRIIAQNVQLRSDVAVLQREITLKNSRGLLSNSSQKQLSRHENTGTIQRLSQQNQRLKEELGEALKALGTWTPLQQNQQNLPPQQSPLTPKLQQRLGQFNDRLHNVIAGTVPNSPSQKSVTQWQKEKAQLVQHYQGQLSRAKRESRQVNLAVSQSSSGKLAGSGVGWINNLENQRMKDQIVFLQTRNKEQEERNAQLIAVNQQLQGKIQSVLKVRQGNAALQYYKQQCTQFESDNQQLKSKVRKLGEECRGYKMQLAGKNTKLREDYEFKMLQLELKVQEQQRKIVYLQSQRATSDQPQTNIVPAKPLEQSRRASKHETNVRYSTFQQEVSSKPSSRVIPIQEEFYSVMGNYQEKVSSSPKWAYSYQLDKY